MRAFALSAAVVLVTGCASQPATAPATATATAAPAAAVAAPTPVGTTAPPASKKPTTVQEALRAGYKVVDQNGQKMYCREQMKTGSHVQRETICLTEEQLAAAREASKRNFDQMARPIPPPWGK